MSEIDELREQFAWHVCRAYRVPMSMIDGRPWVPTEAEADTGE